MLYSTSFINHFLTAGWLWNHRSTVTLLFLLVFVIERSINIWFSNDSSRSVGHRALEAKLVSLSIRLHHTQSFVVPCASLHFRTFWLIITIQDWKSIETPRPSTLELLATFSLQAFVFFSISSSFLMLLFFNCIQLKHTWPIVFDNYSWIRMTMATDELFLAHFHYFWCTCISWFGGWLSNYRQKSRLIVFALISLPDQAEVSWIFHQAAWFRWFMFCLLFIIGKFNPKHHIDIVIVLFLKTL